MIKTDPIRMSDHHHRVIAIAPIEAARQLKISAFLAAIILAAAAVMSLGALFSSSSTAAQSEPVTAVAQAF